MERCEEIITTLPLYKHDFSSKSNKKQLIDIIIEQFKDLQEYIEGTQNILNILYAQISKKGAIYLLAAMLKTLQFYLKLILSKIHMKEANTHDYEFVANLIQRIEVNFAAVYKQIKFNIELVMSNRGQMELLTKIRAELLDLKDESQKPHELHKLHKSIDVMSAQKFIISIQNVDTNLGKIILNWRIDEV